nr:hypothetical protein [Tanacetum cinerariifolium]
MVSALLEGYVVTGTTNIFQTSYWDLWTNRFSTPFFHSLLGPEFNALDLSDMLFLGNPLHRLPLFRAKLFHIRSLKDVGITQMKDSIFIWYDDRIGYGGKSFPSIPLP